MTSTDWKNLEQNLCSAVSHLERYDQLVSSGDRWEELELLAALSSAKVCIGQAQTNLLCPSAVDPIVTSRTKYQCLELLVRHGNNVLYFTVLQCNVM